MKTILFIVAFVVLAFNSFSQDYMVLKDGEKVAITILHVADEYVRYRLFGDRSGKMYAKVTSKISKLIFQDGTVKTYPEKTVQDSRDVLNRPNDNNHQIQNQKGDSLFMVDGKINPVIVCEITPKCVK
jgi:hypothetical protein